MSPGQTTRADLTAAGVEPKLVAAALSWLASPVLLTGGYVYVVSTVPAVASAAHLLVSPSGAPIRVQLSLVTGLGALVALFAGVWATSSRRHQLARLLGIWCFLAMLTATWLLHPSASEAGRIDPWRGLFGALGFALFALAWGVPDAFKRSRPEDDPRADLLPELEPRDNLPRSALLALGVSISAAAALVALAFRMSDAHRGVLGQALAALASVALVSSAARHASRAVPWVPAEPRVRLSRAGRAIFALALLLAVALVRLALGA